VRSAGVRIVIRAACAIALLAGCSRREPSRTEGSGGSVASSSSASSASAVSAASGAPASHARAVRGRKGGTDVTFLVVSDTHFGFGGIEPAHEVLVPAMNGIEGRAYPPPLAGAVARPRGVLVTGDLTEWGKVEEWTPFVATYGLTGVEGKLRLPVFEVIGNHDKVHGPWVEQQVATRHGGKRFYAWDWDDVRFLALGEAPDDEGLAFVEAEIASVARDVPLVLYFHLALSGPWSTGNWFADGSHRARLGALLEGRKVAAIFHGHHHATGHYTWQSIDVFKPGAVKDGAHTFAVVRITDDRFTLASYDWDRGSWSSAHPPYAKPLAN